MSLSRTLRQKFPFLRYSFLSGALNGRNVIRTGQMGDGREEATAEYVIANAPAGDVDAAIDAIDNFAYDKSILMNVGDEKGQLLTPPLRAQTRSSPWNSAPIADTAGCGSPERHRVPRCSQSRSRVPTPRWPDACGRTPASPIASPVLTAPSMTERRSRSSPRTTDSPRAVWISCS